MPRPPWFAPLLLLGLVGCGSAQGQPRPPAASPAKPVAASTEGMVLIPGGSFQMGADDAPFPHEAPAHRVQIGSFWLDRDEVTNDAFARFVAATGFVSEAERWGWSIVFDPRKQEWVQVHGADWRHPEGPKSSLDGRGREPVVQVSWNDAVAFAQWAGKRLPTEAEYEYALRGGGQAEGPYPWGDTLLPGGASQANLWQGEFPRADAGSDGHRRAAPVGSFPPGPFGLRDLTGNAWEWCADFYDPAYYSQSPTANPQGPASGHARVLRGGSFLCSQNYCTGYRVTARSQCDPDSATNHMGFRCALTAPTVARSPRP